MSHVALELVKFKFILVISGPRFLTQGRFRRTQANCSCDALKYMLLVMKLIWSEIPEGKITRTNLSLEAHIGLLLFLN